VGNTLERTENDNYRSDREMGICAMRVVVRNSKVEEAEVRQEEQRAVENDLRRLTGLVPFPPPPERAPPDSTPVGLYCRLLDDAAQWRWMLPTPAEGQTPIQRPSAPPRVFRAPPEPRTPELPEGQIVSRPPLISAGATASADAQVRGVRERRAMYQVEIQKKYALATACLVFALLGVPVAIRFARGGIGLVIAMSLSVFTIYYVGLIGGEELGNRQTISPFFAMWSANLLFTLVGLVALALARRPGQSATGGDWADVKMALLRWVRWAR
jgi:lipopolysaccharide export system permease protein